MEVPFVPRTIKGMHTVWVFLATNTSHKFGSNMKYFQYFILLFDVQRIRFLGASPYQSFPLPGKEWNSWKEGLHLIPGEILTHFSKNRGLFFFIISSAQKLKTEIVIYWQTPKCGEGLVREGRLSSKSHKEFWLSKEIMMFSIFGDPQSNFSEQVCVGDCDVATSDNTTLNLKIFFSHCSTKNSVIVWDSIFIKEGGGDWSACLTLTTMEHVNSNLLK